MSPVSPEDLDQLEATDFAALDELARRTFKRQGAPSQAGFTDDEEVAKRRLQLHTREAWRGGDGERFSNWARAYGRDLERELARRVQEAGARDAAEIRDLRTQVKRATEIVAGRADPALEAARAEHERAAKIAQDNYEVLLKRISDVDAELNRAGVSAYGGSAVRVSVLRAERDSSRSSASYWSLKCSNATAELERAERTIRNLRRSAKRAKSKKSAKKGK